MALNPITYTERVVKNFLRYQLTAYPFADADFYEQMKRLLSLEEERRSPLLKGPFVSLSRSFTTGASVQDLVRDGVFHDFLTQIIPHPNLYGHQERAIRSIHDGHPTLVSTGTGSGKTECFLYPIISHCLRLRDEGVPTGIAAVLVYPMNALAEDQLGRLRELLAGTGITFGMYVGKTPREKSGVTGLRLPGGASRSDYRAKLKQMRDENRGVAVHPSEERCSREEMRTAGEQPRILLTNVKQLELLLTRQADVELFDGARLDYLVFDEAHTFSGAAGAETACLIRRLRAFCGKDPGETRCVATSATIADPRDPSAARTFASRFFGVPTENVRVVGEEYEPDVWAKSRTVPDPLPGNAVAHLHAVLAAVGADQDAGAKVAVAFKGMGGLQINPSSWQEELHVRLSENELVYELAEILQTPQPLPELVQLLKKKVNRAVPEEEVLAWLALGAAARKKEKPLLRPVIHAFVRGVGGGVVSFPEGRERPLLQLSAEEDAEGEDQAHLPVLTCTTCGQHYFEHHVADFDFLKSTPEGGEAVEGGVLWRKLAPANSGKRVILLDRVISAPDEEDDPDRTAEIFCCRYCAALHSTNGDRCRACGTGGELVRLLAVQQKEKHPGQLTRCVACGSPGRAIGSYYREPARQVRAISVADVHILAQDMIHHAERRRLLVFADNRQDAAFQAGWMKDHARRFRLRALMAERIEEGAVGAGDLVAALDRLLDADSNLSRALLPEVWDYVRKEKAGNEHAQERKFFLRLQVLRELATGIRQRFGLEAWGRAKIKYLGLDSKDAFIQQSAEKLKCSAEEMLEGVRGLLDVLRRNLHLLDRDTGIFSKAHWDERAVERGYIPQFPGVPKGLKLRREGADDKRWVTGWMSTHLTTVREILLKWGLKADDVQGFAQELWDYLVEKKVLAPVTLKGSKGRMLPNCAGTYQIDADLLQIEPHRGYHECRKCRRAYIRSAPGKKCYGWHCDGELIFKEENADDYNLTILDGRFSMLRAEEHSAQVPVAERDRLEILFKGDSEAVNTLVCTPTLELGVDIGSLDAVLMRNVPPLAANYWQRAGRAGRRHRMAVNLTYCRNATHDRSYFAEPLKLLGGKVDPPRFNLRNELMVAKHVHAVVLTRLYQLGRDGNGLGDADRQEIGEVLAEILPQQIKSYLFDTTGNVLATPLDPAPFGALLRKHVEDLVRYVSKVFDQEWPWEDRHVVSEETLRQYVNDTAARLGEVIRRLKKRLDWARSQLTRLDSIRRLKGALEPADEALHGRCDRLVKKLKGQQFRRRQEAEGYDDTNTYSVLAAEGFLPGYGLETGAVIGTAVMPKSATLGDFTLPRPPAVALRELVPGNLIYANSNRFTARNYHLEAQGKTLQFQVDRENQAVKEVGEGVGQEGSASAAGLAALNLPAVPICDVDLSHMSRITDDEQFRFQMGVATYGSELDRHGGGKAYRWGGRAIHLLKSAHFRLVNVGPVREVEGTGELGYPLCTVCGQSRSPFSSQTERDRFATDHQERCGRPIKRIGFYADVVADALKIVGCANKEEAYSIAETIRAAASVVLEMDRDDLQLMILSRPGAEEVEAVLYDPMPGGSGLLEQLCVERFGEVVRKAKEIAGRCPAGCDTACIDCLHTFRNAYYHRFLNRKAADELLKEYGPHLREDHEIPARMPASPPSPSEMPVNLAEAMLGEMLRAAGFQEPQWHKQIQIGQPYGTTSPDCFYEMEDEEEPGICIYLDGLSQHIHGNSETQALDHQMRSQLRSKGFEVIEIARTDLDDRGAMVLHFRKLARYLIGREKASEVKENSGWFDRGQAQRAKISGAAQKMVPRYFQWLSTTGAGSLAATK